MKAYIKLTLPLWVAALPLGLSNSLSQPLSAILLLPLIAVAFALKRSKIATLLLLLAITVTAIRITASAAHEYSIYQMVRSGLPFLYICIVLGSYKQLQTYISTKFSTLDPDGSRTEKLAYIYVTLQTIQVVALYLDIPIANVASKSDGDSFRLMLYPMTSIVLLFYYGWRQQMWILTGMAALIIFSTGSKTYLAAMLILIPIATASRLSSWRLLTSTLGILTLCGIVYYTNPLSITRLASYITEERGADITREYEISHAKSTFQQDALTMLAGNGLAHPLTPGVPTSDERWFENSKYDIENAYWSILAKLGILGSTLTSMMLVRTIKNKTMIATGIILLIFGLKTSYQFFTTFDGTLLLLWSILIAEACQRRSNKCNLRHIQAHELKPINFRR